MVAERLFDVRGTRVVVTGAASGLGFAMAEVLAQAGARLTLADVADAGQVDALIDGAVAAYGGLDVVFANAGISLEPGFKDPGGGLAGIDPEQWRRVIAVDFDGVMATLRAAARVMKPQGSGRIVVTASTAGLRTDPMVGYSYATAKAAVIAATRQAALELAPHGVLVNALAPGAIRTRIGGGVLPGPEIERMWADTIPLGRMGEPEEIKGLVLLLASPASSYITGAILPVDGGALTRSHTL
jgi:NAD(P)-dependent dehydrogenase (short-subunit alcohol dehydrogenase family)